MKLRFTPTKTIVAQPLDTKSIIAGIKTTLFEGEKAEYHDGKDGAILLEIKSASAAVREQVIATAKTICSRGDMTFQELKEGNNEFPDLQEMIAILSHYLNDYSDEIPTERVTKEQRSKVTTTWFRSINKHLQYTLFYFLSKNKALENERASFFKTWRERRMAATEKMQRGQRQDDFVPTTKEEIDAMNTLLKKVIENLAQTLNRSLTRF